MTPAVAVLHEIKNRHPDAEIRFWCDKKFSKQARNIVQKFDKNIKVDVITSGKLRRYHHLTIWQHLAKFKDIIWPNLIDSFRIVAGVFQCAFKMIIWRPDVIFTKGGYVCLPIGIAAYVLRIPLVIHDSDAHPGLTNRVLAKWAKFIGTGAPLEFYNFPKSITRYVGVPVGKDFYPRTKKDRIALKESIGFDGNRPLVVVTGGGLGAQRINKAICDNIDDILKVTNVILICGQHNYADLKDKMPENDERFKLFAFVSKGMSDMLAAADLVVARAGATTILELAGLAKPTILIPNAMLTGGHQVKNALVYEKAGAVDVLSEEEMEADSNIILNKIVDLLKDDKKMQEMGREFYKFAKPDAAKDMADMILSAIK